MRKVEDLTKEELSLIVKRVQQLLYLDNDTENYFWNPEKEWSVDLLDYIADTLSAIELVPDAVKIIEPV